MNDSPVLVSEYGVAIPWARVFSVEATQVPPGTPIDDDCDERTVPMTRQYVHVEIVCDADGNGAVLAFYATPRQYVCIANGWYEELNRREKVGHMEIPTEKGTTP